MAGGVPAPPDEVGGHAQKEVNSGGYGVLWDDIERKCVCTGDRATVVEDLGKQHGVAAAAVEHGLVEGLCGSRGEGAAGQRNERSLMKADLKSSFELRKKVICEDYEKPIYQMKSESFNWKIIDDICESKKLFNDKPST